MTKKNTHELLYVLQRRIFTPQKSIIKNQANSNLIPSVHQKYSSKEYMQNKNRITNNIFWLTTEYIVRMSGGLLISAILARQLGVEQYGFFQYSLSLVFVFSSISFVCGAEILVPKLVHATEHEKNIIIGNAFFLRLVFSFLAYALLILFCSLTESKANVELTAILGITLLLTEAFAVITAWLQSQTHNRPRSILINFVILIKTALIYILYLQNNTNSKFYATAWAVESLLTACGLVYIYQKNHKIKIFQFNKVELKKLWIEGLPFFIGLMAACLYIRLDIIMLKTLGTPHDLGLYASATQLLLAMTAFSGILVTSMAPLMIYKQKDSKNIKKNILIMSIAAVGFALTTATSASLIAPWLLPIFFGEKYTNATPIFINLTWASTLYFLDASLNIYLIKIRRGNLVTLKWAVAIIFAFPAHFFLIPRYHAYGAVMGYVAGYAAACLMGLYYLFQKEPN